jgi:hypothetical protein
VSVPSQEREWAVMYVCVMHPFIGQSSWLMYLYQPGKGVSGHVCMCYASIHWSIILIDVSVPSQEREWAVMYVRVIHPFIGQSSWLVFLYQARKGSGRSCMHVLCIHSLVNHLNWCVCTKPGKRVSGHVCMCYASIHWSIILIDVSVPSQKREWAVMYVCVMHPFIGQSSSHLIFTYII